MAATNDRPPAHQPIDAGRSVWIFSAYAVPADAGFGTRHFDLGRALSRLGWDVTIFAGSVNHATGRNERVRGWALRRTQLVDGVRFVWLRTPGYRGNSGGRVLNMLAYGIVALLGQAGRPPPDAIVGSTPHPFAALAALVTASLRRRPFYYEVRDLWPQTMVDLGVMRERSPFVRMLRGVEALLFRRSRAVISLLQGTADYARWRGLSATRIEYLPNGVDLEEQESAAPEAVSAQARLAAVKARHGFVGLYAGSLGLANNAAVLVETAGVLSERGRSDIAIVIIGDGPDRSRIEKRAAQLGLDNLYILEAVAKAAIPAVLAQADALILHFRNNPVHRFGVSFNKLYDYMAAGKPILFACDTPYNPVHEVDAGLTVAPDSPAELADGLILLDDASQEHRSHMGNRASRYVRANHDIERLAERLSRLLDPAGGSGRRKTLVQAH